MSEKENPLGFFYAQVQLAARALFLLAVVGISVWTFKPVTFKANPALVQALLTGSNAGFTPMGAGVAEILPHLPKRTGEVTLILDTHRKAKTKAAELHNEIQNAAAPLQVSPEPVAPVAIVYTSDSQTARNRLNVLGYRFVKETSPGKGVAVRKRL